MVHKDNNRLVVTKTIGRLVVVVNPGLNVLEVPTYHTSYNERQEDLELPKNQNDYQ